MTRPVDTRLLSNNAGRSGGTGRSSRAEKQISFRCLPRRTSRSFHGVPRKRSNSAADFGAFAPLPKPHSAKTYEFPARGSRAEKRMSFPFLSRHLSVVFGTSAKTVVLLASNDPVVASRSSFATSHRLEPQRLVARCCPERFSLGIGSGRRSSCRQSFHRR